MQERLFYISELIGKELNGTIGDDETTVLNEWMNSSVSNKLLFEQLHNEEFVKMQLEKFDRYDAEKNRAYLMKKLEEEVVSRQSLVVSMKPRVRLWKKIAIAASIVGVLFVGYWLMKDKTTDDRPQTTVVQTNDVQAPDKNRAQIKLSDGTVVYLDSAANGELANMNGVVVKKTEDGKIVYSGESGVVSGELKYNTLSNPRGSKVIDMTLADGSRVWLNAGSSVTYPVAFVTNERKVSITGEAYFEVAHNASKPFFVSKGDMSVQVLGTHFNVNAYNDEAEIKVTLLEGSVKVTGNKTSLTIKPNQQAIVKSENAVALNSGVDVAEVMAWKNGQFIFNGSDIKSIMREAARWYDLDVEYRGTINKTFKGKVPRTVNISELFQIMEATGWVHFKIEGKKVVVTP